MEIAKTKAPGLAGQPGLKNSTKESNTPHKWWRVLEALARGGTYNRFEAERALSDHCLHSTVATIQDLGVKVAREFETVPGYRGLPTRVRRYWLTPEEIPKANAILALTGPGKRRRAAPEEFANSGWGS
jgi:hypothetical protein